MLATLPRCRSGEHVWENMVRGKQRLVHAYDYSSITLGVSCDVTYAGLLEYVLHCVLGEFSSILVLSVVSGRPPEHHIEHKACQTYTNCWFVVMRYEHYATTIEILQRNSRHANSSISNMLS